MSAAGRAFGLILVLVCLAGALPGRETLRLPWVFSDEPDLSADFSFEAAQDGKTQVTLELGGRFAGFGLPAGASRAPRLEIMAEITAPSELERAVGSVASVVDLGEVLAEYGLSFARQHFREGSSLVYKASLATPLAPGDYNVRVQLKDEGLGVDSWRTLHLLVPALDPTQWQLGDLKFITAVGKRLNEKGKEERVLDPNPWRQVGAKLGWDLMVAYSDVGPRPPGTLKRRASIRRLRGDEAELWRDDSPAPAKRREQVWILHLSEAELKTWKAGTYLLQVELSAGGRSVKSSKTFEVLP